MVRLFVYSVLLLGLAACTYSGSGGSAYTETGAICDVAGLESQLVGLRDQSRQTRGALGVGLPQGGGAIGGSNSTNDVERVYQLRDRLNRFDAEMDIQYRAITQSCRAYARCMEMRGYREGQCRSSLDRWDQSQRDFSSLTRELREIDAEVAKIRVISRNNGCVNCGRHRVNPCDGCGCGGNVGGVFANC